MSVAAHRFHTREVDGEIVTGVAYDEDAGALFEFVDPRSHENYERWHDIRRDTVRVYDDLVDYAVSVSDDADTLRRFKPTADAWDAIREQYRDGSLTAAEAWTALTDD